MIAVHPFGKHGPVLRLEDVIFHLFADALANPAVELVQLSEHDLGVLNPGLNCPPLVLGDWWQ